MNNLFFHYTIIATCFCIIFLCFSLLMVVLSKELRRKKESEQNKLIRELLDSFAFKDAIISIVNDEIKYLNELKDTNKNE